MQILATEGDISRFEADAVVVNLFEGVTKPEGGTGAVDRALDGILSRELELQRDLFKGKAEQTLILPTYGKIPARFVIVVGLGKAADLNASVLRRAAAVAVRACHKLKVKSAGILLNGAGVGGFDVRAAARLLGEGAALGAYRFTLRKSGKKSSANGSEAEEENGRSEGLERLTVVEYQADRLDAVREGLKVAEVLARNVNLARNWVNDAPNHVTPAFLKEQAEQIHGLTCHVLDRARIQELGMGAFAMVARGSAHPPYLIHLTYRPEENVRKNEVRKKIALVGKGITFDSGGLSLKPSGSMELMKMDMSGAAAVIATMKAIAELGDLPVEVHGFAPVCENMPDGNASRPGDIVTAMNGKTIEINNTDAEGRLILADALTYAQKQTNPDELIDLATLTGACITALGKAAAGVIGQDDALIARIRQAGERAGEKLWQLPLYEEYRAFLKSDVADIINSGAKGEAGASAGARFLQEFVDAKRPWAHLDIAGPAWTSTDVPEVPKGGTGFGVRTLLYYLYEWS